MPLQHWAPETMTDYTLSRSQTAAVIRGSAIDNSPSLMLTRTYSVPDVYAYRRLGDPYKPQWTVYNYPFPQYRPYFPYRYLRDTYLSQYASPNHYWYNKYYRFTPMFKRSGVRRYFHFRPDLDDPSHSQRCYDPFYTPFWDGYSVGNWNPYRSHLI